VKRKFKIILFVLIPLLIAFGVLLFINREHPPSHADQNQDVMKYSVDEEYVRWAFHKLQSSFPDSNDLLLDQYFVRTRDTVIQEEKKTVYFVFFSYYWKEHPQELYYSKMGFDNWRPVILIYNQPVAGSGAFERMSDKMKRPKFEIMSN
jgi:hypothetical protein